MDGSRFDQLARALSGAGTRRGLLRMVAALPLLAGLADVPDAAADSCARKCRKKSNKKARRRCRKRCQKPQPPACETNADCLPGEVCQNGQCLPGPDECTTDGDCGACESCGNGVCVSTCGQGAICRGDQCCQPLTACPDGRDCGVMDDQCGGLLQCGPNSCGDGFFCFDNRCFCPQGYETCQGACCDVDEVCAGGDGPCCTPNCDGKACGENDDCGGACQEGRCPICHFCREGICGQELPGTFCGGASDETICLFDGECGAFTCDVSDDCPGDCRCPPDVTSGLCYEGSVRGCPGAAACVDFACPARFECFVCPGGEPRCIPLCSG